MTIKHTLPALLFLTLTIPVIVHAQQTDSIAENMLIYQRPSGGWPKIFGLALWPIDYSKRLSEDSKHVIRRDTEHYESTIDNDATVPEIRYLVKAYHTTGNKSYLKAAEKGIDYLLAAQYDNGGWPQFYPLKKGYYTHITYNDDAMINVMRLLKDVTNGAEGMDVVDKSYIPKSAHAVEKGIDCILRTQVKVNGRLTVWCAQHDEHTLQPAPARAFELVSLSGLESVPLISFLMQIKDPSPEVVRAICSAVDWFYRSRIEGYNFVFVKDEKQAAKGTDAVLVPDPQSTLWARFYDISTNQPIFVGKDGIARHAVTDIENERRTGYAWYGHWGVKLLNDEYPAWLKAHPTPDAPVIAAVPAHPGSSTAFSAASNAVADAKQEVDHTPPPPTIPKTSLVQDGPTVADIDGNIYPVIHVGSQSWTGENLRVARYRNGDSVTWAPDKDQWAAMTAGACSDYRNQASLDTAYGKLYNWYAISDRRGLCPKGWHVPSDADWQRLEDYLGGKGKAGAIKALHGWDPPNGGGTNAGGFGALGGGIRGFYGKYGSIGTFGYYWSSTETPEGTAWFRKLDCYSPKLYRDDGMKPAGFSCRCVQD